MKIEEITKSISEKLGEEKSAIIADDMASLITMDTNYRQKINEKDEEIKTLKKDKEVLITANGNLLQKVSQESDEILNPTPKEETRRDPFDMRSIFDEKGRFKAKM